MSRKLIRLSSRPPVSIDETEWTQLVKEVYTWTDSEIASQANRTTKQIFGVLQSEAKSKTIVHARFVHDTAFPQENDYDFKAGVVLDTTDLERTAQAILEVASQMEAFLDELRMLRLDQVPERCLLTWRAAAEDVIGQLPPTQL